MNDVDWVSCPGDKTLKLEISTRANPTEVAERFHPGTFVHGGSRWKCKDLKSGSRDFYAKVINLSIQGRIIVLQVDQVSPAALFEHLSYEVSCKSVKASKKRDLDKSVDFQRSFTGDLIAIMKQQGNSISCGGCSFQAQYSLDFSDTEIYSSFATTLMYPTTCTSGLACDWGCSLSCWTCVCNCRIAESCSQSIFPNGIQGSVNSWVNLKGYSNQQVYGSVTGNFPSGQPISIQTENPFDLLANQNVPELSFTFTVGPVAVTLNTNFQLNATANIQIQGNAFSFNAASGLGFSAQLGASAQFSATLSGSASGGASPTQDFNQKPNSASASFSLTGGAPSGAIGIDLIPILSLGLDAGLNLGALSSLASNLAHEHFAVTVSIEFMHIFRSV